MAQDELNENMDRLITWAILRGRRNEQLKAIEQEVFQLRQSLNDQFNDFLNRIREIDPGDISSAKI